MLTGNLTLEVKKTLARSQLHLINTNMKHHEAVPKAPKQVIEAITTEPTMRQRQPLRTKKSNLEI